MSIYEYNEEKVMQALREEAMEQGREEERKGRKEAEKLFSRQNILIKVLAESGRTEVVLFFEKLREELKLV